MKTEEILKTCQLNPGASEGAIRDAATSLGCSLPDDYVQFLRTHDGGEGFIGDNYLILWKVEELSIFNCEYEVEKYAPGLLLFASSGGGAGYGFDKRDAAMPVVSFEFIGMNLNEVDRVANSFTDFLALLAK
jgi:hypothetical protein